MIDQPWNRFLRSTEGINTSQYNMLRILRGSGEDGLTRGEVTVRMINRDPDVAGLLHELMGRGLVEHGHDRAGEPLQQLVITKAGLECLARLTDAVTKMPGRLLGHLGADRLRDLDELLGAVIEGDLHFP